MDTRYDRRSCERLLPALVAALLVAPSGAWAQESEADGSPGRIEAEATLVDRSGREIGTATLIETPTGGVLVRLELSAAPAGEHALHVHETGSCEPTFAAAGDHYTPEESQHGFLSEQGHHAGDLPNLHVPESGRLEVELVASDLALSPSESHTVFDGDGSALIMHEGPDDYTSQPSGAAGTEVACGVIRPREHLGG